MERLSITTHLMAILTAFSAFTMPIALDVLNRIRDRYGSSHYMKVIENIMGFKVHLLFRELIVTLASLILFSLFVALANPHYFTASLVLLFEYLFSFVVLFLLHKEYQFIKTVFKATRSDKLVTNHLISMISKPPIKNEHHSKEVELLIQIACYNIENAKISTTDSIQQRLFSLVNKSYSDEAGAIDADTAKMLISGLAVVLTSARNSNDRGLYITLQRCYAKHLIMFFDRKLKESSIFHGYSEEFYEECIKELGSDQYWLMKADFLISLRTWDIQSPQTIKFIDGIVRNLIDFSVKMKPELIPEIIDRYRNLIGFDSYFCEDLHKLPALFGDYNGKHFKEIVGLKAGYNEHLSSSPEKISEQFEELLSKHTIDAMAGAKSTEQIGKIEENAKIYARDMMQELIKDIAANAAKSTAQYAIRVLAAQNLWVHILDSHEIFSSASSNVQLLGVNILPSSLSSVIHELGEAHSISMRRSRELRSSYQKAVPLLLMYNLYCWRIKNPEKCLLEGVGNLASSFSVIGRTIMQINDTLSNMTLVRYFSKSPEYSTTLCNHFNISHETKSFHTGVIRMIDEITKRLNEELLNLIKNQPLSEELKRKYINEATTIPEDYVEIFPLLSKVTLVPEKQNPINVGLLQYPRKTFLDNTGVATIFFNREIIKAVHNSIAKKHLTTEGRPLKNLQVSELKDDDLLIVSNSDWHAWAK